MTERIILLDMDDVLCDLTGSWIQLLNNRHGTNIVREDLSIWHIGRALPLKFPGLTSSDIYAPLDEPGMFRNLPIMPGAKEALEEMLTLGWRPVIVTSLPSVKHKPGMVVQEKIEWVEKHLAGLVAPRDIVITYRKYLVRGDVLVDDAGHNLKTFPGHTLAFDRPWNRKIESTARIDHWDQGVETLKKIFKIRTWHRENK